MGFLGSWDETKNLDAYSGHINASARLPASLSIGDTRLVANALDLGSGGGWFWPLFGGGTRPHEICAGLVPTDAGLPAGWMHAAPLLVLEQASVQARPGRVSERYTLHAHAHAFIAETVRAGGIAVTRLDAELMRPRHSTDRTHRAYRRNRRRTARRHAGTPFAGGAFGSSERELVMIARQ